MIQTSYEPYIEECENALKKCRDFFSQHSLKPEEIFSYARVINAFYHAGITTSQQLAAKSAVELLQIGQLGITSLKVITQTCNKLYEANFDLDKLHPCKAETVKPWYEIKSRISIILDERYANILCSNFESSAFFEKMYTEIIDLFKSTFEHDKFIGTRNFDIMSKRVFDEQTLSAIAKEYNLSRERIRQIAKKVARIVGGRIRKGAFDIETRNKYLNILNSIDDIVFFDFIAYIQTRNDTVYYWILKTIADNTILFKKYIQTVDFKKSLYCDNNDKKTALSNMAQILNDLNLPDITIHVSKFYTQKFGKTVWSNELFYEISNAYLSLNEYEKAGKFAELITNKASEKYKQLSAAISKHKDYKPIEF